MKDDMCDRWRHMVTNKMDPSQQQGGVRQDVWPLCHSEAQKHQLKMTFQPALLSPSIQVTSISGEKPTQYIFH